MTESDRSSDTEIEHGDFHHPCDNGTDLSTSTDLDVGPVLLPFPSPNNVSGEWSKGIPVGPNADTEAPDDAGAVILPLSRKERAS